MAIKTEVSSQFRERAEILKLVTVGGVGIELGVAEGHFSAELLSKRHLSHLYSIDMYAGDAGHDNHQYLRALKALLPFREKNTLIKMRFDEILHFFEDETFDLIYVDGYAHTGEEGGKTFADWYPKLKVGGVFAGHDYVAEYPLVIEAVNNFATQFDLTLTIIDDRGTGWNNGNATWFTIKK